MKIHLVPTLLSSILAFSGVATAGDMMKKGAGQGAQTPDFSELDADKDGYVTRSDVQEHDELASRWEQLDTNADQQLDRAEFSAFENMQTDPGTGRDPGMGTDPSQEGTETIR